MANLDLISSTLQNPYRQWSVYIHHWRGFKYRWQHIRAADKLNAPSFVSLRSVDNQGYFTYMPYRLFLGLSFKRLPGYYKPCNLSTCANNSLKFESDQCGRAHYLEVKVSFCLHHGLH